MTRKQFWGVAAFIIILTGAAVFYIRHELLDIRQYQQETDEAEKLFEESMKKKETPEKVNVDRVNAGEVDSVKASDADIEKILKELAAEGKVSEADVEKLLEDVAAEEEEVEEKTLSPEELAKREERRKAREFWDKIGKIVGGGIHSSTHPEKMQELVRLFEEAAGGPTILTDMNNLATMLQKYVDTNGNVRTSDLLKLADSHESVPGEFGEFISTGATFYRNLAQYAKIKGYEEVNLYEIMTNPPDDFEKVLKEHYESTK
ncbi:hypothetical protein C6501_03785 [Candidatus Poribacteria bacterium]|nr:MAG: hypothetical protein C6501_03785 [Candidatus Poribacteria bacterium]